MPPLCLLSFASCSNVSHQYKKNIKDIKLKSKEIKISQLAHDTTLILESCESIKYVKYLSQNCELIAGVKTHMEKTQAFMIDKHMKHFKNDYNINWTDGPIHILGLHICKTEIKL